MVVPLKDGVPKWIIPKESKEKHYVIHQPMESMLRAHSSDKIKDSWLTC